MSNPTEDNRPVKGPLGEANVNEAYPENPLEVPKELQNKAEIEAGTVETPTDESQAVTQPENTENPSEDENTQFIDERQKQTLDKLARAGKERKKMIVEFANIVRSDDEAIHNIKDVKLRDSVAKEVFGTDYKTYTKLSSLDDSEPGYEERRKLIEIEQRLSKAEEKEQKAIASKFFKSKGVIESEYDDTYSNVMDALEKRFNQSYIRDNYEDALNEAYRLEIGGDKTNDHAQKISEKLSTPVGRGQSTAKKRSSNKLSAAEARMYRGLNVTLPK